jgi:hypothetical protein
MPDNNNNSTEPARKRTPTLIPRFKTIIEEGNQEIVRQAEALVKRTLDSAKPADARALRRLGDDGTRYFFKRLKARVREQVSAAAATRSFPSSRKTVVATGLHAFQGKILAILATARALVLRSGKVTAPQRASAPVVAVTNWKARQRYRASYVTAALVRGLLAAMILTIASVIFLRLSA